MDNGTVHYGTIECGCRGRGSGPPVAPGGIWKITRLLYIVVQNVRDWEATLGDGLVYD